jgi:hypothetical protein
MSKERSVWSIVPKRSITGSAPSACGADRARRGFLAGPGAPDVAERISAIVDPPG